ncbi:hypothetical protein AURDEDRAFT_151245 [Auricularia subglabra TFB-10046 SS5]|nr:hypothetical protein AURDEDRAFT_151245 [Auricularia subglabra TFB-10046 SS5]
MSAFSAAVNPHSHAVRRTISEKVIPWSKTPFDESITDESQLLKKEFSDNEEEEEYTPEDVPQWLELFFDLAWTITFSGLTGGTPIKDGSTIASYSVFFVLAWWLWVSQVLYDTKYYTNDWWHRIMLILQFVAFGALASFTEGFDIFNGITHDATTDGVELQVEDAYVARAFKAICLVFGFTRFLLAIQYIRVSRLIKHSRGGNIFMTIASLVVSGFLFFITFFVLVAFPRGFSGSLAHIAKFILWALALMTEIGVFMYSSSPWGLVRQGSMSERLATLTTVVLGEGLNGLIEPLVSVAKSVGFNLASAAQILSIGLLVLMVFILYFATFDTRAPISPMRQKIIIFLHFPTQLVITLLLEGMKSVLGFLTLSQSLTTFLVSAFTVPRGDTALEQFQLLYASIGLDLNAIATKLAKVPITDPETADENVRTAALGVRIIASGIPPILEQFNLMTDELKDTFENYTSGVTPSPGQAVQDAMDSLAGDDNLFPRLDRIIAEIQTEQLSPVSYIAGVAGAFLLCLLLLMLIRGNKHVDRYFAWSIVTRFIIAVGLIMLVLLDLQPVKLLNFISKGAFTSWITQVSLLFVSLSAANYALKVIHVFMARDVKRLLSQAAPPLPPKYEV